MKTCNDYQKLILDEINTEEIHDHIKICTECNDLYNLMNTQETELNFVLNDDLVSKEINTVLKKIDKKLKIKEYISMIIFIITATALILSFLTLISFTGKVIFIYIIVVSLLMPISLLILTLVRTRKEVY